jgi:hypothetical protein
VCTVIASAVFGAIITVMLGSDPGTPLGVFVIIGTLIAGLAVRAKSVWLIIPAPALCYLVTATLAGAINDRSTDTSHLADLVHIGTWIANGFVAMMVATILAIGLAAGRWLVDKRGHSDRPRRMFLMPVWRNRPHQPAGRPRSPRPPAGATGSQRPRPDQPAGATGPQRPRPDQPAAAAQRPRPSQPADGSGPQRPRPRPPADATRPIRPAGPSSTQPGQIRPGAGPGTGPGQRPPQPDRYSLSSGA